MKIKLNKESIATVTEIMRIVDCDNPSRIVNQSLRMSATIASMPEAQQLIVIQLLETYGCKNINEPA